MRHILATICFVSLAATTSLIAQSVNDEPKQTARQALIEMFLGKKPDSFVKHLPEETRRALIHKGDTPEGSWALRFAEIGRGMTMTGNKVETFDDGPAILVMEEPNSKEKFEVFVEHDSLMGESDEIELSIKYWKDGQETALPVVPRLIFTMTQEKEIWRLAEITAAAHVPLTDPDYLKNLRKMQDESNEGMVQMRVNMIVGSEKAYAAQHRDRGYVCNLSTVLGQDQSAPAQTAPQQPQPSIMENDSVADQIAPSVATGVTWFNTNEQPELWNGYRFTLSGCDGSPASKFVVTAAPINPEPSAETKTFCADESGAIKFTTGGKASSCISNGQPLNQGAVGYAPQAVEE